MGKDYYVYQHTAFYEYAPNILPSLFDYVNGSFNMGQLRENILKRQPYKQGCSVNDLIDLEGVKTKEDLFHKFESGIQAVLDSIEDEKDSEARLKRKQNALRNEIKLNKTLV